MVYVWLGLLVFGINLLPAFAPATWTILIFYKLNTNVNSVAIVAIGVLAAAAGRYLLALGSRRLRNKLPDKYLTNLTNAKSLLSKNRKFGVLYILLFIFSPLPSAQIFEAAGIAQAPLLPLTAAFAVGRAVSYSLAVGGANSLKNHGLGSIFIDSLTSPLGIALQVTCLLAIYLLMRIDWAKYVHIGAKDS